MRKLPKIINQEEFEKLLKATEKKEYKLAMLLAFEAGMRISEIVGYKDRVPALTADRVEESGIRIIAGKGNKDRVVPRPKRVNEAAKKFLPLQISRRSLQHHVSTLGKRILDRDITFHTLRHGFGTHLANSGRPMHEIKLLMGHSSISTTDIYLHANPKQALEKARDIF